MNRRQRAIRRIQRRLLARGWPRLQVSLVFLVAGLVAFGCSVLLLRFGVSQMWLRYAVSACVAYGAFLLLLRLLVHTLRRRIELDVGVEDTLDVLDAASRVPGPKEPRGGGSDASDLGAFDVSDLPVPDLDEGVALLVPLLILLAGIAGALYVLYLAPVLLAELVLDVLIVSNLARRFERIPPESWVRGALRHTFAPFLLVLFTVTAVGFLAEQITPGADSIGDVFRSED